MPIGCKCSLDFLVQPPQPFHHLRITVGEETTCLSVQCSYFLHIFFSQFKIEYIEIRNDAFFADGLWDNHYISLYQPAQHHLGDRFVILVRDCRQRFIPE